MICPKCKQVVDDDSVYCIFCGKKIEEAISRVNSMEFGTIIQEGFKLANKGWQGILLCIGCSLIILTLGLIFFNAVMTQEQHAIVDKIILQTQPKQSVVDTKNPAAVLAAKNQRKEMAVAFHTLCKENAISAILVFIIFLMISFGLSAGIIYYYNEILHGGDPGISVMIVAARKYFLRIFAAHFLVLAVLGVVVECPLLWSLLVKHFVILHSTPLSLNKSIIFMGIAVASWMSVRLAFTPIAVVIENLGPVNALKNSFKMSRGYWWKLSGILVCPLVAGNIIKLMVLACVDAVGGPLIALGQVSYMFWFVHTMIFCTVTFYISLIILASYVFMYNGIKIEEIAVNEKDASLG
ncbi:MAG: hypothetical protein ABSH12_05770 [Endomicrobiales bacterium]